jgi:hypothetical protein
LRHHLTLALGVIVSAFFAWLGFRGLSLSELIDALGSIHVLWLIPAVGVYFIAVYILTWRWYYLLRPVKEVNPNQLYGTVIMGYMGNNIYPARIGELLRAYLLKRNQQLDYAPSLATILVERIFDGLVLLSFILTALLFVDFDEPLIKDILTAAAPIFFGALLVFTFLAMRPELTRRLYTAIINKFAPTATQEKLLGLADRFMSGLAALTKPQLLALTWFSSVASWTVEASTYWIVLQAFDFRVSFWVLMLVMGIANLTTVLPSTPGYVGTFHGAVVLTLVAFDVPSEVAGPYAIVMHMVLWLPITLTGGLLLWRQGMSWRDLGQASSFAESEAAA